MKILVAVDGSDSANRALEFAARLAAQSQAELSIVTVHQHVVDEDVKCFGRIENATIWDLLEQEAASLLRASRTSAAKLGVGKISTHADDGDPASVLLERARECDLMVIGRRGRGRLTGLLLGSVSQKLAALSPVPIVIVP